MILAILDSRDNVATALIDLPAGTTATAGEATVALREDIPRGHKVALAPIPSNTDVIRYGEIIGSATTDIDTGTHVHVHNVVSKRLPGGGR